MAACTASSSGEPCVVQLELHEQEMRRRQVWTHLPYQWGLAVSVVDHSNRQYRTAFGI